MGQAVTGCDVWRATHWISQELYKIQLLRREKPHRVHPVGGHPMENYLTAVVPGKIILQFERRRVAMSGRRRGRGSISGSTANERTALCQFRSLCGRDFIARGLGPLVVATSEKFAPRFALVWSVRVKLCKAAKKKGRKRQNPGRTVAARPRRKAGSPSAAAAEPRTDHLQNTT